MLRQMDKKILTTLLPKVLLSGHVMLLILPIIADLDAITDLCFKNLKILASHCSSTSQFESKLAEK